MNVKTAVRTLDLFEVFAQQRKPLNLSELANALGMPVSSCFALVRTLESRGYLYMLAARKGIYPTKRMLDVARDIVAHDPVLDRVQPTLSALRDATGETVVFSKRQGDHIVYLDVYDSPNSIRYNAQIGEFRTLYASSMGKAFLGTLSLPEYDKTVSGLALDRISDKTLVTREALDADIAASRERGWYCNAGESVADLIGLAVTVSVAGEHYGVSVAGPVYRMSDAVSSHAQALLDAKKAIESAG